MKPIDSYDVIVCGAGMAGSMAAVAAGRTGARVLVIEEEGYPGGSMTAMGTGPMMTFHAGEMQAVRGLTEELIARLKKKNLSPGHIIDSTGYTYTVTPFSAEGMKRELELMMIESGVTLLYHTVITGAKVEDGVIQHLTCFSCGENFEVTGKVFIDATGDGDVMYLSGAPYKQGRDSDGKDQPMTMNYKIMGVDIARIRELMEKTPEIFPFLYPKAGIQKKAPRLSFSGFQDIMKKGIADGEITFDRDIVLCFETDVAGEVIVNMSRILDENPVDPFSLSRAETEGRRQVWELFDFMKHKVPGFENTRLLSTGPRVGVRSSRRMVGCYTLTAEDILSERKFEDGVAASGYPIDIHSADGTETDSRFLREGGYYTIPYRCLINDGVKNLMSAGRNISASFEAQASTRTSPCCGALGHAAGTAAALAALEGVLPTELDAALLREHLRRADAVID